LYNVSYRPAQRHTDGRDITQAIHFLGLAARHFVRHQLCGLRRDTPMGISNHLQDVGNPIMKILRKLATIDGIDFLAICSGLHKD
jgi:hypothetical protein